MMKKMTKVLFCLAVWAMLVCSINAQNAAKNWIFGYNAKVDFNSTPPSVSTGTISTFEGSSSISDSNGNLLFYTDGRNVWNKSDVTMPNGTGLSGNPSSTQAALIVPCSCGGKYFIFTTDDGEHDYVNGLRYSVVDMTTNGGLGSVLLPKNIPLIAPAAEKIAGISDGNGGFWVVGHDIKSSPATPGGNRFYSYHVTSPSCQLNQVSAPVISQVGTVYTQRLPTAAYLPGGAGQMKISPDGELLAVAGFTYGVPANSFVELFKFDVNTGAVSALAGTVRDETTPGYYGIEFSPNSKSLYATTEAPDMNFLYRYDVSGKTLGARSTIANFGTGKYRSGALQLAPDGKMYIARFRETYLNVLPSPDAPGPWADVRLNLASGATSSLGLPTVVSGDFSCGQQGCCDQVKQTPFWTPDLSLSWKAFEVFNVKFPASNICSIDIDIRNGSNQQPPNPWNGGGLKVNGMALPVPTWWKSPYTRIPNGGQPAIAGLPNFSAAAVNFNLGLDYSGSYTGKVKLIIRHCDGTSCEYLSDSWTPEPPTQLVMRTSERYLGDTRGEFLPLALAFSDGVNIKGKAAWIAVEPLDADTEVFSVDVDRVPEVEDSAGKQPQLVIASARKQERSALYELARPVDLEQFTGGEIKLVLKRSVGNYLKPRLRFLFFDENANMIGYVTNESGK